MNDLTWEENVYLTERGFRIVEGEPPQDGPYPYFMLREKCHPLGELRYALSKTTCRVTAGVCHPSQEREDLEQLIIKTAGENINFDGEGSIMHTTPGTPITIFVADPAWNDVARNVAAQYPALTV